MAIFNTSVVHPSWLPLLNEALATLEPSYVQQLLSKPDWLPGVDKIFSAFSLPLQKTHYILFGESPYPRPQSAIGYAFWDAAVSKLWSETGLSSAVNRATSLRNILKMLLVAEGLLDSKNTTQLAISAVDKNALVQTGSELFENFMKHGILLLNASLVFRKTLVNKDAAAWRPFMDKLLSLLAKRHTSITLILLGKIAAAIDPLPGAKTYSKFHAEHPFNLSFIHNPKVIAFFKPLHLLKR